MDVVGPGQVISLWFPLPTMLWRTLKKSEEKELEVTKMLFLFRVRWWSLVGLESLCGSLHTLKTSLEPMKVSDEVTVGCCHYLLIGTHMWCGRTCWKPDIWHCGIDMLSSYAHCHILHRKVLLVSFVFCWWCWGFASKTSSSSSESLLTLSVENLGLSVGNLNPQLSDFSYRLIVQPAGFFKGGLEVKNLGKQPLLKLLILQAANKVIAQGLLKAGEVALLGHLTWQRLSLSLWEPNHTCKMHDSKQSLRERNGPSVTAWWCWRVCFWTESGPPNRRPPWMWISHRWWRMWHAVFPHLQSHWLWDKIQIWLDSLPSLLVWCWKVQCGLWQPWSQLWASDFNKQFS